MTLQTLSGNVFEEQREEKSYLLAEVERWDIGFLKVMRHSMSSPARNTGPRAMEATTSIIWDVRSQQRQITVIQYNIV